jgi:hypothetical protein
MKDRRRPEGRRQPASKLRDLAAQAKRPRPQRPERSVLGGLEQKSRR